MKGFLISLLGLGFLFSLSACGGGGGGVTVNIGSNTTVPVTNFTGWSSVNPPEIVEVEGMSQVSTFTTNDAPPPTFLYTNKDVDTAASMVTIEYGFDGTIESIKVETPTGSLTWDEGAGDLIQDGTKRIVLIDDSSTNFAAAVHPLHQDTGWEYQAFGAWESGRGSGSGTFGGISMGLPTTGSSIPATGDVTFTGETLGVYITADGSDYLTYSDLAVDVDFANLGLGLDLSTTNTMKIPVGNLPGGAGVSDPTLNFAGTLLFDADANAFSGPVSGVGWIGASEGQFYGPNAEELGGVFSLSGMDGVHSGAYGAAR